MGVVIAKALQRGGGGKSQAAKHAGAKLALLGHRCLLIDTDPQASLSTGLGLKTSEVEKHTGNVLLGEAKMSEVIIQQVRPNLDIVPANIHLSRAEPKLLGMMMREHKLKNALNEVRDQYDFTFIDCPPSLGLLTINALVAADRVIIPVPCDIEGLVGLKLLLETINEIKAQANPNLSVLGIVVTRYDARTNVSKDIFETIHQQLGQHYRVFKTALKENSSLKEAAMAGKTIYEYDARSSWAIDFDAFINELLAAYEQDKAN